MKKLITFAIALIICMACFAQTEEPVDAKEQRQLRKSARREAKKIEEQNALILTKHLLDTRRFALIADFIGNKTGNRIPVNPTINFIIVDTSSCVIQVGSMNSIGYNGVGGVTAEGSISTYEIIPDKKGTSFTIRFVTNTSIGTYDIIIFVNAFGNAEATITGITSGALRYYGRVLPVDNSRTYQGRSL